MFRSYGTIFILTLLSSALTLVAVNRFLWKSDMNVPVIAVAMATAAVLGIYSARTDDR